MLKHSLLWYIFLWKDVIYLVMKLSSWCLVFLSECFCPFCSFPPSILNICFLPIFASFPFLYISFFLPFLTKQVWKSEFNGWQRNQKAEARSWLLAQGMAKVYALMFRCPFICIFRCLQIYTYVVFQQFWNCNFTLAEFDIEAIVVHFLILFNLHSTS